MFINSCLQHSYIPDNVSCGIISPLIKDKLRDQSVVENYRPIMNSSVFLKVFEYIILSKIYMFLGTNDRQHGFKPKHSTSTACYILKETILHYFNNLSPVYAAFLDFSKAFDYVRHDVLFNKLIAVGVPGFYVRFIAYWYCNQNVKIKFNGSFSSSWKIKN